MSQSLGVTNCLSLPRAKDFPGPWTFGAKTETFQGKWSELSSYQIHLWSPMFLFLSATKQCLITPRATMSATSPEASRPVPALGPTAKTRRSTMGVPAQRMRYSLILPSTTMCNSKTPRHGQKNPPIRVHLKTRRFYLDS